ncbi:TlpA disulfide reductase family protein [Pedobacter sp. JY14-1]|uniref:TlpA family protein disulfide reductase n=1 Tax=Pedobacter sp. JY14-1 TaxID=3034151 RepID=UPI0023E0CA90|nr:TlpA disulfide reductase family protein [Pedobacter sp. JY14-1]
MKRSLTLSFLLVLLFCFHSNAAVKIPAKLQGLWLIESTTKGNWDALTIAGNQIEFFYDLYQVDSISGVAPKYHIWLSNKVKGKISLRAELSSDSTGSFQFDKWDKPKTCRQVSKHPDMVYYPIDQVQKEVNGEWVSGDQLNDSFSIKGRQILLQGQKWDIQWFGKYLNREYRALIKNKNNYRLIYITGNGRTRRIAAEGAAKSYSAKANNPAVYQLLGNWYDPEANKWTFGFFEDFAIYNNEFWNYQELKFSAKKCRVTLKNRDKTINLIVEKTNDSLVSVQAENQVHRQYKRAGKTLPPYATSDETTFKDTHFQQVDTAYITGYLRNAPNLEPFRVSRINIIKGDEEEIYADVDSLGRFLIKVPLLNTQQVFLDWHRMQKIDILEPGEHYFLYHDFNSGQYLMMGDDVRLHNELASYQPYAAFALTEEENSRRAEVNKMKGMDYLQAKKAELKKANTFFANYLKRNLHLSAKTRYFVWNFNRYNIGFYLMQKRFDLDRRNREHFPAEYMAYVKDSLFIDPVEPYTLVRDFSTFSRDYVQYMKQDIRESGVSHLQTLLRLINNGTIPASDPEKKAVMLSWQIDSIANVDSIRAKQLTKKLNLNQSKLVSNLRLKHQSLITDVATETLVYNMLQSDIAGNRQLIPNEDIRNTYNVQAIMSYLDMTRKPLESGKFEAALQEIKSPVFQTSVQDYQNFLLKKTTIDFAYAASLKNTEHLKSSKDADSLFKALLEPYKGKVVYIDFWGTWCGPCREEMKYVGKAKEALKGKDVIFMYFANNSPEFTWKNMIKELDLTGENVVHYRLPDSQQYMLERRLSVSSFPTYMLVDKTGNITTTKAPRPSNPDELVTKVDELLKQ